MSFFNDDFYSAKVSKRVHKRLSSRHYSSNKNLWHWLSKSSIQIALITSVTTAVIVSLIFFTYVNVNPSAGETASDFSERSITASSKVRPAVVSIVNEQKYSLGLNSRLLDEFSKESGVYKKASVGSGVIISKDEQFAYIVTNYHVLNKAQRIKVVLTTDEEHYAEVVGQDKISDIAVIKIPAAGISEVAQIGDSSTLRSAEFVLAMGNPLGMGESTTLGIISVKSEIVGVALESMGVIDWEQEVIRVDAAINQGNSGGPLIDMNGQVVGINSMKISDFGVESIGYAIPINNVMPIVQQLIEQGYVSRPFLGIYMMNLEAYFQQEAVNKELQAMLDAEAQGEGSQLEGNSLKLALPSHVLDGVLVYEVEGPAKAAGLKPNDVIVQLDEIEVKSILDLRRYLFSKSIGDTITVHFYRGEAKLSVDVVLTETKPNL